MTVSLNGAGRSHAASLIAAGKVDKDSSWSMSAEDENKILGDPPKWDEYSKWHLGIDASADKETKAHYKYPFGKAGKVYRSALIAIRQRAGQQGADAIFAAAGSLLEKIDGKKEGDSMELNIERRIFPMTFRAAADGAAAKIGGVAAVFNSLSENLGGFREQIIPGAFKSALNNADIRSLINHDPNRILGRTTSKTLRLAETERGLEWDCDTPDTSYARDLAVSVQRGDINQCSFSFAVDDGGDTWQKDAAGMWTRSIHGVARLYDVSPVTYPAYPDTKCAMRCLDKIKATEIPPFDHIGISRMKLELDTIL